MVDNVVRGNIVLVDFGRGMYSEQGGERPAVVVQNNIGNKHSTTTVVVPYTTKTKSNLPTHVFLSKEHGTDRDSIAMAEQIRVVDKKRIRKCLGKLSVTKMKEIDIALKEELNLI